MDCLIFAGSAVLRGEFLELVCTGKTFDRAHAVDVEDAVEMVDLMLERPCEETAGGDRLRQIVLVDIGDRDLLGTDEMTADIGKAQASLLVVLRALAHQDLRIPELQRHGNRRIERGVELLFAAVGDVDDTHPFGPPDLLRGEPHALRLMHRLQHVIRELPQLRRNRLDRDAVLAQHLLAVLIDF